MPDILFLGSLPEGFWPVISLVSYFQSIFISYAEVLMKWTCRYCILAKSQIGVKHQPWRPRRCSWWPRWGVSTFTGLLVQWVMVIEWSFNHNQTPSQSIKLYEWILDIKHIFWYCYRVMGVALSIHISFFKIHVDDRIAEIINKTRII